MIAVLGEAVVDLVGQGDRLYQAHPGGSPLNVAVGLGRLERPTALLARLSRDAFGAMFRRHLAASGVSDALLVEADEPSTLAVATVDATGVATYDFWVQGTADWQWTAAELDRLDGADALALHTGSMALEIDPGAAAILDLLRRCRGRLAVSYDPNVRMARRGPVADGRARVESVVALADLVKVSADDLDWLYPGEDPAGVAARWTAAGPGLVVATLGPAGALARTGAGVEARRPAVAVDVVDTVGAGDAFMSGLLDGLAGRHLLGPDSRARLAAIDEPALDALLDRASLVAALTCARAGADPPTRAELDAVSAGGPAGG